MNASSYDDRGRGFPGDASSSFGLLPGRHYPAVDHDEYGLRDLRVAHLADRADQVEHAARDVREAEETVTYAPGNRVLDEMNAPYAPVQRNVALVQRNVARDERTEVAR